ncbi:MAG: Mucin-like glycoprotein [Phormidium sp. OSCR]|nr:MAG: Mucin-like glycoprotein [Phormidium sp. OSCR]
MTSKFFALLLALTVPLALVGCSGDDTTNEETSTSETTETPADNSTADTSPTSEDTSDGSTTSETNTGDWFTYEPPDGRYQIKFPQEPLEQNETISVSENQEIELSLAIYEDGSQGRAYMSGANPIPLPEGESFDVEQGLDGGRDNAAASTNSEIESEETISIEGLPARSIIMRNPEGIRFKLMMIADAEDAVLYQLLVGAQDGDIDFPEAETFFDSFKITRS